MLKNLSYFLVAVLIIGGSKVLQIYFNDALERYGDNKQKMKKQAIESVKKMESEAKGEASKIPVTDSTVFENREPLDSVTSESYFNEPDTSFATNYESNDFGTSSFDDETYFQNLINSYLKPIVASLPEGRSREDVTIRYYTHEKDGDHVYALRTLGYYLHEKEATETKGMESNVLIYGSDVDVRDIHIVAYTLLTNEVPLKGISPSRYTWKFHALEVGTNPSLEDRPIMTLSDIQNFEMD